MKDYGLPNIKEQFPEWYNEVIYKSELIDQSPVRGTMIIRPYGYALWEEIKQELDKRIKETGHQNVAFPLFIPQSFLKKEKEHVEGFSPELAVVTHAGGKKLEEPLVVRPTSEVLVHHMFARWLKSWRDLPLKINQWANVVRWELRPRPFLRTTEFFWQEGHTAHETKEEAEEEVQKMMNEYVDFVQNYLAIPVITGTKSESEKFPGAEKTLTLEAILPDGKALQLGTSHLLSQNFAKAFDMKFQDKNEKLAYPYLTSWGVTTRLIGATVMMHGDQKGLILPPKIAPIQVVIIPILKSKQDNEAVLAQVATIYTELKKDGVRVVTDDDQSKTPGAKFYEWELKGVPLRIELGPKDLEKQQVIIVDRLGLAKDAIPFSDIKRCVQGKLEEIQQELYKRALEKQKAVTFTGEDLKEFGPKIVKDSGLYQVGWCLSPLCEQKLKEYQATIRCLVDSRKAKKCFACGDMSKVDILVAKAY